MIDDNVAYGWAQNAHMLAGSVVVFAALDLYPPSLWYVVVGFVLLTGWKEVWYDAIYETVDERGSSWSDWIHYQIGVVAALALHFVAGYFH